MPYRIAAVVAVIVLLSSICLAAPLNSSDLIISWTGSSSSYAQEYTLSGALVQSWTIPTFAAENAHGVGVDASGNVIVYNGTFSPSLTVIDPITGTRTNYSYAGWNTVNNVHFGNLAVSGHYAYATDDEAANDGPNQNGVVRFDTTNGSAQRFLAGSDTTSLSLGLDNTLYVVWPDTSPGQNELPMMDPQTMAVKNTLNLPMAISGATADALGNIYVSSGSTIYKLDDQGNILGSLNTAFALDNIKISPTDQLLSDNNGGQIVLTTTALASYSEWGLNEPNAQLYESFADFVTPAPELEPSRFWGYRFCCCFVEVNLLEAGWRRVRSATVWADFAGNGIGRASELG